MRILCSVATTRQLAKPSLRREHAERSAWENSPESFLRCRHRPNWPGPFAAERACLQRQAAFTLVELVLVLVVLSILATVAIESVEPEVDQSRFEATQAALKNLETAVLGSNDARAADGTRIVGGFIADVGRPPQSLEELYLLPTGMPEFTTDSPPGDDEVIIQGGWNGPYLRLPVGATTLVDGWGNPFNLFNRDGDLLPANEEMAIIRSNGQDGVVAGTGYNQDLLQVFEATAMATSAGNNIVVDSQVQNRWRRPLVVSVFYEDGTTVPDIANGEKLVVRVYGPHVAEPADNPNAIELTTIEQQIVTIDGSPVNVSFDDSTMTMLTIGPRVVRAYQLPSSVADPAEDDELSGHASLTTISTPTRVTVSADTSPISLILRNKPMSP